MNNKGMTLLEVIIALLLLGLITITFLPSTWSSYKMMEKAKEITADTFNAQQIIELEMEKARDKIHEYRKDPTKPDPMTNSINAFGKIIRGVDIKQSILNKDGTANHGDIYVFVADEPIINENLPEVEWIKLLEKNGMSIPVYWKNNNLTGSHKIKDTANYFMSLKRWYVSKPGFDGFIPASGIDESYWGTRYPSWPNDFEIINNNDKDQLMDFSSYIGKHVVFSVIPVARTGKYGAEANSKEIYVMGPPILDNIKFHFDPYTFRNNANEFYLDGSDITNWKDYSIATSFTPTYTDNSKKMQINYIDNDGKTIILNDSEAKINSFNPTNTDNFTIFVVYKNRYTTAASQNIIKRNRSSNNNGWEIKLNNNKLEFKINKSGVQTKSIVQSTDTEASKKYIISARMSSSNMKLILDRNDDKEEISDTFSSYSTDNNSTITLTLGGTSSQQNIYEIIIYNAPLSDDDVNKVRNYLAEKHRIKLKN
ncbi:MAG: prepilin-type N-terminal cleavage/methylation domain-containing protein [Lutispora sp.]|nr:prepilin-type N-terminal cleavage/methylation domain-containing protein [Lutispora sp.]